MYKPILDENFKDIMQLRDGKFYIDSDNKVVQKRLLMAVNDNVHKNLEGFSVKLFDQDQRFNKEEFSSREKELLVDKLIQNDLKKQEEMIFDATDRILLAHRNLKLCLFLTSGPFFAVLFLFKYTIKFGVLYFLYNKKKEKENATNITTGE